MEFRYEIDATLGLVLEHCEGPVTMDDLRGMIRAVWEDPLYSPEYRGVCDFEGAHLAFTKAELQATFRELLPDPRYSRGFWVLIAPLPLATAFAVLYRNEAADRHPLTILSSADGLAECGRFTSAEVGRIKRFLAGRREPAVS